MAMRTMQATQLRMEWLSWDGNVLRWRIEIQGVPAATALLLDGVVFSRYAPCAEGTHEFECVFEYAPTGRYAMRLDLVKEDFPSPQAAQPWHVVFGAALEPGRDAAVSGDMELQPLMAPPRLPGRGLGDLPPVTIIVPIYNSAQCVKRCIAAVLRWSPRNALILVDDASTDAAIEPILHAAAAQSPHVSIHRNASNRGFTHSVNVGMQLAGGADVVLLNSDTQVGPRWLQALKIAAYSDDAVGTVTAVSDNAGAFSVPELESYCATPQRWTLVQTQRALLQNAGTMYPQLPTGNGFCMYVKRKVLARIGPFDEIAFAQGYGEENDFCQRAIRAGFVNIIAGNVLVQHARSASFGAARRAELGARGMSILRERYPQYERDVAATLYSFARRVLDYRVRFTYAAADALALRQVPRARLLIAADAQDGAAIKLLGALRARQEGFLLRHENEYLNLYRDSDAGLTRERSIAVALAPDGLGRIEQALCEWLVDFAIEVVHLRGSAARDEWLARIAARLEIPVT